MIGQNLRRFISPAICPTHAELDLTNRGQVREYLRHNKPESIIHCASNDDETCLFDNLRMFVNLAESHIPMMIFSTGRDIEDRPGKVGEYILSKHIAQELSLNKYSHITVIKLWGCFGRYEKDSRFIRSNFLRVKAGLPIIVTENKLFSFVYVNELARIIKNLIMWKPERELINIVGYTYSLLEYAEIIKDITGSPHQIIVEGSNFSRSYVGPEERFSHINIKEAIKEYWGEFNRCPGS